VHTGAALGVAEASVAPASSMTTASSPTARRGGRHGVLFHQRPAVSSDLAAVSVPSPAAAAVESRACLTRLERGPGEAHARVSGVSSVTTDCAAGFSVALR
jgi:hypothetical protein